MNCIVLACEAKIHNYTRYQVFGAYIMKNLILFLDDYQGKILR